MNIHNHIETLNERHPLLISCQDDIINAYNILKSTIEKKGTIFCCGNGGSYSDSQHIVGELLKSFKINRPIYNYDKERLINLFGEQGLFLGDNLERGIKALCLGSQSAFSFAFSNDVDGRLVFAQELLALGNSGDTLVCLSSSGNSENVKYAAMIAKYTGIKVILLTGTNNGSIDEFSDCIINVPEKETYKIQELHLPIYHTLCLALEEWYMNQ
ncbi:D-sedoheptulose-7-phosphate isomerase [Enterococcus alishanensis]